MVAATSPMPRRQTPRRAGPRGVDGVRHGGRGTDEGERLTGRLTKRMPVRPHACADP